MPRNKKFRNGDVVYRDTGYGVVIDHTTYADGSTAYLVYPTDKWGRDIHKSSWVKTSRLAAVINGRGNPRRVKGWTRWRHSSTR